MDIETIKKFIDAGYKKEDIDKMEATGNNSPSDDNAGSDNEGAGKEQETTKQENAPKVETTADETLKALTKTVKGLTETVKAMQDSNIENANGGKGDNKQGINDVMKSFIETL